MLGLWLDRMNGVFQLNRNGLPATGRGRMRAVSPVFMFRRVMLPPWLSAYTRSGLVGSTRQTKPSPPLTNSQSSLIGPFGPRVRVGPPQVPLSCSPP